jgi:uncharacterized secreted protein with C-terminal beta-propeller domain
MHLLRLTFLTSLLLLIIPFSSELQAAPKPAQPQITAINGKTIRVKVPAGIRKVTLQMRAKKKAWTAKMVAHLDGTGGIVKFVLKHAVQRGDVRVIGDTTDGALPFAFTTGSALNLDTGVTPGSIKNFSLSSTADTGASTPARTVEESDIYQTSGNTLYFFNQYRGLQLIDLTNPDAPKLLSTLRMPATGEDMYLLGTHAVLLRHDVQLQLSGQTTNSNSAVTLVDVSNSVSPSVVANLPIHGWTIESRLVGSVLYVASNYYDTDSSGDASSGVEVASFDLTDPTAPVQRDAVDLPGYGFVVNATDNFFFVAGYSSDWSHSLVNVIGISDPTGALTNNGSAATAGYLYDKNNLGESNGVLTAVSQNWSSSATVETFSLAIPASPVKLGSIALGQNEWVDASNIAGTLAYVETSDSVDPLWIVDLSTPSAPTIASKLAVTGFSNSLVPLANGQLLTLGSVNGQTAVTLFDVSNPASPAQLSQVTIGDGYTYSEAQWDDRAFKVLPDAHLILVPYSDWSSSGVAQAVQLIDLNATSLALRGVIDQPFGPRRATVFSNRILSISGQDLLTVNATNEDAPVVTSDLQLAYSADRIFAAGTHLIEIANGDSWSGISPGITIATKADPNTAVAQISLASSAPVVGATLRNGKLYVAQASPEQYPTSTIGGATPDFVIAAQFVVSIYDASALPALPLLGSDSEPLDQAGNTEFNALWLDDATLIWTPPAQQRWFWGFQPLTASGGGVVAKRSFIKNSVNPGTIMKVSPVSDLFIWPFRQNSSKPFFAFDVSTPDAPALLSAQNVKADSTLGYSSYSFSDASVAGHKVYVSYRTAPYLRYWPQNAAGGKQLTVNEDSTPSGTGSAVTADFLVTLDYTNASAPVASTPVNIPGDLIGVSADGSTLYTTGSWFPNYWLDSASTSTFNLQASSFDGTNVTLLDTATYSNTSDNNALLDGDVIFSATGTYDANWNETGTLDTWQLNSAQKFVKLGSATLDEAATSLTQVGNLIIAPAWDGSFDLFDASTPTAPTALGQFTLSVSWSADFTAADGAAGVGLGVPLGLYGVDAFDLSH